MPDKKFRGISNLPVAIPDVPDAPTVSASNVGTSRAYNNGAATVTITSPTGGLPTSYSVTTTPTTVTTTTSTSPITLTGLSSATSYTVSATATNGTGVTTAATTSSSITATTVPNAPTMGSPTVATAQSYSGSANVSVPFTAPATGGSSITGYTVTSSSGNNNTGSSSPILVLDTVGVACTYTVTATNANGVSTASSASAATTPSSVPQAPTIGTFTDGGTGTTGTLSFTAPATGGSAITNYKYSTDSSTYTALSPSQTTSPLSLTGLTAGTYNFSVKAVNANGDSAASGTVSGTVVTPSSFYNIATLTPSGSGDVTFSSIPQTYKSLQLRVVNMSSTFGNNIGIYFNGNFATNYTGHSLSGDGTTASASGGINRYYIYVDTAASQSTYPVVSITDIIDYSSTSKYKVARIFGGGDKNGAYSAVNLSSGMWLSTSAITSITITSGVFASGSSIALYGVN
jgi:hypothetical protein